jgi:hypothetical protein
MRKWLVALLLSASSLFGQTVHIPFLWVEPHVRMQINQDWSNMAGQPERAYCARFNLEINRRGDPEFTIIEAWRAIEKNPTPQSISEAICVTAQGDTWPKDVTLMHVHPPHTSADDIYGYSPLRKPGVYLPDGIEAYQCQASPTDWASFLFKTQFPFEVIICAPNAFVPYWRTPYIVTNPQEHSNKKKRKRK